MWRWVCAIINICTIQPNKKGPPPTILVWLNRSFQTPGWEGNPQGLAGTEDEAGFQARSPQDGGGGAGSPQGENMATAPTDP